MKTPNPKGWYRQSPEAQFRDAVQTKRPDHWSYDSTKRIRQRPTAKVNREALDSAQALLDAALAAAMAGK